MDDGFELLKEAFGGGRCGGARGGHYGSDGRWTTSQVREDDAFWETISFHGRERS